MLPRTEEGYGDKKHVGPGRVVWLDVDHTSPEAVIAALTADSGPLALPVPTMVINSGNGVHIYWRLTEPLEPVRIVEINKGIVHYAQTVMGLSGADRAATDCARIMRLPGTVNHKGGRMCHIHRLIPEAVESPAYWNQWVGQIPPPTPQKKELTSAVLPARKPQRNGTRAVTGIRRAFAYASKMSGIVEGGRNNAAFRLACFCLHDCGIDEAETVNVLAAWDVYNQPPLAVTDGGPGILQEIVRNAATYGGRQ